ncbi:MAG: hypothetical protein EBZ69_05160, partial [Alphaproteobacteria bacterium]|nr:hypothetical protein [Alphaproteobacteria bacterium]
MPLQKVTVGRRQYIVGLEWQVSPSGKVADAAREAAKQSGVYNAYVTRQPSKSGRLGQFGMGQNPQQKDWRTPSLAMSVANVIHGSWAGAFRVREGIVILVVRDDLITPDGDQFYLDETEARARLFQEINLGGLEKVFAPEAWSVTGADNVSLVLQLQDKVDGSLQPVDIPKEWIKLVAFGAGVVALLIVAGLLWQNYEQEQERLRQAQLDAARRAQELAQQQFPSQLQPKAIEYPPPRRYWEEEPRPLELAEACRKALTKSDLAYLGWDLREISCNKSGLSLGWIQEKGRYAKVIPETVPDPTLTSASKAIPLEGLVNRGKEDLLDP